MKLSRLDLFGKDKKLASISTVGVHVGKEGECIPHINFGNGNRSYRVDMTVREANDLIEQLRQQIESSYNSGKNGRINNWYELDQINPELKINN